MQQLISHLLIICDNVYKENAFAVYDPNLFQFCTYSASHSMPPPLPVCYIYIYIDLGQIHPALLLMRQWCQSFNHLFRVTQNFGFFFFRNHSNKN